MDRRRALADFLRSRRERLTPHDVGILPGPRRRTPGLRREEVAQLSGVSVTWYTWLEQARDITVSRQVLHSLARVLLLSPAEARHLFALAEETKETASTPSASTPAPTHNPALQRLVDALDPHPAYLIAPNWDLVAWNRAEAGLIGDPARWEPADRNLLRFVFLEPRARDLLADWPGQARALLEQYRAGADRHTGDPEFAGLTRELAGRSEEFRTWWDTHDVADFRPARRAFDHPRLGRLSFDYVKLNAADAPGLSLVACLPADDETAGKLPGLAP
ncbi:helix-turn-helix transcriptional regulator [Streptomyces hiroshimensis]|uniref:DNA-binding protein n=1 Tax=Streptomyces hiroshimensis TaxID=66424 RepID=A0ABQ2YC74_9ACTN|nr:helix-turn-helix transcriptional regulator [Streptomyces hiroshimensis]GGX79093.1 putative DNA-binding protein [Streptomyces hiroshimensis]